MLEARHIAYSYPQGQKPVLKDISLAVDKGSFTAILGANGSGKSTFARVLAGSIRPHAGEVLLDGAPLERGWPEVGFVRQDPQDQLVSESVSEEVAFGLHGLGLAEEERDQRVRLMLEQCSLSYLKDVPTSELSGGEQQRLALAGVLAFGPTYLVLDEPTAHLDSTSRVRFIKIVESLATKDRGIVLITHRLEEALAAQRVVVMDQGCVVWEGSSEEFAEDERAQALAHLDVFDPLRPTDGLPSTRAYEEPCLQLENVSVVLGEYKALRDFTCSSFAGRVTLVTGRSGSGKTTACLTSAGLIRPAEGNVRYMGENVCVGDVGLSLQRPEDQLFCDTVLEDVMYGPLNRGLSHEEALACAQQSLELLGVSKELWDRHPQYLSGGERRRVALAGIVALDVEAYVFDEPTAGLDGDGRKALREVVRELAQRGKAVVIVSHDVDEWLCVADYLKIMDGGSLVYMGPASCYENSAQAFIRAGLVPPRVLGELAAKEGAPVDALEEELCSLNVVEPRPFRVTPLQRIPAGVHIALVLLLTVALYATNSFAVIALILATSIVACAIARVRIREVANLMGAISIVLVFALVANSLILDGTGEIPLAGSIGLSSSGAMRAVRSVMRIISLALMALVVSRSTTSSAIAHALMAPLKPFRRLSGFRDRLWITVMLALRCLPQAVTEFKNVEAAQLVRKAPLRSGGIRKRLSSWVSVLVPAVVALMRRASELGDALCDRGY